QAAEVEVGHPLTVPAARAYPSPVPVLRPLPRPRCSALLLTLPFTPGRNGCRQFAIRAATVATWTSGARAVTATVATWTRGGGRGPQRRRPLTAALDEH